MFWTEDLSARKREILRAIIDDYINTAQPVGSRLLAKKHSLGLSSATIRNEMADLEELGYIAQPHTSAGRVPSDKGYRVYVDHLMQLTEISIEEAKLIKDELQEKIFELNKLIMKASKLVSNITGYTSIAVTPQMKKIIIKAVQVVPIEKGRALIVLVAEAGVVQNDIIQIPQNVEPEMLIRISNIFNEKLAGLNLEQINLPVIQDIQLELDIGAKKELILPVLNGIVRCIEKMDTSEVYINGTTNLLNYPEFNDLIRAKELLEVLEQTESLKDMLKNALSSKSLRVKIGTENDNERIKNCSLITGTYTLGNMTQGSISVIGPTRMDYGKVITSMQYVKRLIDKEIEKILTDIRKDDS